MASPETNVSSWGAVHERNADRINVSVPVLLMAGDSVDGLASGNFTKWNLLFSGNHVSHIRFDRQWHLFWATVWFDALDDFFDVSTLPPSISLARKKKNPIESSQTQILPLLFTRHALNASQDDFSNWIKYAMHWIWFCFFAPNDEMLDWNAEIYARLFT